MKEPGQYPQSQFRKGISLGSRPRLEKRRDCLGSTAPNDLEPDHVVICGKVIMATPNIIYKSRLLCLLRWWDLQGSAICTSHERSIAWNALFRCLELRCLYPQIYHFVMKSWISWEHQKHKLFLTSEKTSAKIMAPLAPINNVKKKSTVFVSFSLRWLHAWPDVSSLFITKCLLSKPTKPQSGLVSNRVLARLGSMPFEALLVMCSVQESVADLVFLGTIDHHIVGLDYDLAMSMMSFSTFLDNLVDVKGVLN